MNIKINNPLIFLKVTATGLDVAHDRIVRITAHKIRPDGQEEKKDRLINPETRLTSEQLQALRLSVEQLESAPRFRNIAKSFAEWMKGCDFAGFGIQKFDIPILREELLRAGVQFDFRRRNVIDMLTIYHQKEKRTLVGAYDFYCGKDLQKAHSAEADTVATLEVLEAQLERYDDLTNDVQWLADYSQKNDFADYAGRIIYNQDHIPVFSFGKHRGKPVEQVLREEPSFYSWIMNNDFTLDTKRVLKEIYDSVKGTK